MSYLIFNQNNELYKIAEDTISLNNLNSALEQLNIKEISLENFNFLRLNQKRAFLINGNIIYEDIKSLYNKELLKNYIDNFIKNIDLFLQSNAQHIFFKKWLDYKSILQSLDLSVITPTIDFIDSKGVKWDKPNPPLTTSLETYLENKNIIALNPLQLP